MHYQRWFMCVTAIKTRRVFAIANGLVKLAKTKKMAIPNQKNTPDQKAIR
jgi:hypothetical protein